MWVQEGQGGAGRAWLCVRVRHWGLVGLGAWGRGWEGESADVHAGEAARALSGLRGGSGGLRACPHDEFQGSECGCEGAREGLGGHGCVYE